MRRLLLGGGLLAALAAALLAAGCGSSNDDGGGGTSADGVTTITFWHGQSRTAQAAYERLVDRFNRTHPSIHVDANSGGVLADAMLTKLTAGLAGGSYPDVAYVFGADLANIARSDKVQDLTQAVRAPDWRWDDFWPGEREAATVSGRVRAVPALADNLGIVYDKKVFDDAGVPYPRADWTWDDFRAVAKRLTDSSKGQYGYSWPGTGGEDTTWRLWPLLWQRGGDIFTPDFGRAAFDTPAGVDSLQLIGDMATQDKSVYVDPDPSSQRAIQLFQNGKLAMIEAGPWVLPDVLDARVDYGVAPLPGYDGNHTTISGSDNWVLFDNGDARSRAAQEFVRWFTAEPQDLELIEGIQSLPLRRSTAETAAYRAYAARMPGTNIFADALGEARSRPALAAYPEVSTAVGEAIVSVLLGRASAADALKQAAQRSDAVLSGSAAGG